MNNGAPELYLRYRPQSFNDVVGQEDAIRQLNVMGKAKAIPHAILFTGPSGTGKTTLARILKNKLKCADIDFKEVNAAKERGIDMVRDIDRHCRTAALGGKCKIWLVDESHSMTSEAQNSFLKLLEDTPHWVYLFLATTDPGKLKPTIKTRCTEIKCKLLSKDDLLQVIDDVVVKEKRKIDSNVRDRIADVADGSARKALVILHAVIGLTDIQEQLKAIELADHQTQAIELARVLLNGGGWNKVADLLKNCNDEPETVRRIVLAYMSKVLRGGGKMAPRAAGVIDVLQFNTYDSGAAGLDLMCWNLCKG